ncbi:MAG: nitroreductase [Arenimonas sp.]
MDPTSLLRQRRSTPSRLLGPPGPDRAQLRELLECAVRVPDHGKLVPWRFLQIAGPAQAALGEFLAARSLERDPKAAAAVVEKDRLRFNHAPLVLTVIARLSPGHKVPEQEQLLSGGAVCLQLLQAASALGFGAQWLTGWPAYDPSVSIRLGLAENERVLGFIHIGTAREQVPEREHPDPMALLTELGP